MLPHPFCPTMLFFLSGKGILLGVVQVLQGVLQTLFLHFIPCVILVSPRKSFITNSICSENYFPFKQPKPVGWETTSKWSGISPGRGNSVLAHCLSGQQTYFFICLTEGFDHGDKQVKIVCKESYLPRGQWLHIPRGLLTLISHDSWSDVFDILKSEKNLLFPVKKIILCVM